MTETGMFFGNKDVSRKQDVFQGVMSEKQNTLVTKE